MTRVLVCGAGSIGKRHIRNLFATGLSWSAVFAVDPRANRRREAMELGVPEENVFRDSAEALRARSFDAAIVATPTALHMADAIGLAKAGSHLMIEKPLAVDLADFDQLSAALREGGVSAFVAYCYRFNDLARAFRRLIAEGTVGRILYARGEMATFLPDWHPHEDYREFYMARRELGGGTLLDQSHLIDLTRMLLGDIRGVFGVSCKKSELEIDTDDFGEFVLDLQRGIHASLHLSLFTRPARQSYQVTGDLGTLEWDILARRLVRRHPSGKEEVFEEGSDYNHMYVEEMDYFLKAVDSGGAAEEPRLDDAWAAMRVIEAIRASNGERYVAIGSA